MTTPDVAAVAFDTGKNQLQAAIASFITSGQFEDALAELKLAKKKLNSAKYGIARGTLTTAEAIAGKDEEE